MVTLKPGRLPQADVKNVIFFVRPKLELMDIITDNVLRYGGCRGGKAAAARGRLVVLFLGAGRGGDGFGLKLPCGLSRLGSKRGTACRHRSCSAAARGARVGVRGSLGRERGLSLRLATERVHSSLRGCTFLLISWNESCFD